MTEQFDLFGNKVENKTSLQEVYGANPFTILNTADGKWQARKQKWKSLGIKGEVGRDVEVYGAIKQSLGTGQSVFDPVLAELMYRWFAPPHGNILDPFAGGSVRGIVAHYLGYKYHGIDIRQEQVDSNRQQAIEILPINNQPQWYVGDSNKLLEQKWNIQFDFLFSCPPYADLEKYSDLDGDISNMKYKDFLVAYRSIIKKSCSLLKKDAFACFVVGEVRDNKGNYYGFVPDTIRAFMDCGMSYYNEAILQNQVGSGAIRAHGNMKSKKLVKIHQNILVFKKNNKTNQLNLF